MANISDQSNVDDSSIMEHLFTRIYDRNVWRDPVTFSGAGSSSTQTVNIIKELPLLFKELNVATILDIPCGDFNWMQCVDLTGIDYTGADIVQGIIDVNIERHGKENIKFLHLNLIDSDLPKVDLIICRDCLVHFSYEYVVRALDNIKRSGSKYLLTTTFPEKQYNPNIPIGWWHPYNLEIKPFFLSPPIKLINEGCTQGKNQTEFKDKSLGLWEINSLDTVLGPRRKK